jgi:hypothetical protein
MATATPRWQILPAVKLGGGEARPSMVVAASFTKAFRQIFTSQLTTLEMAS